MNKDQITVYFQTKVRAADTAGTLSERDTDGEMRNATSTKAAGKASFYEVGVVRWVGEWVLVSRYIGSELRGEEY